MSGTVRNVLAELNDEPVTLDEYKAAFTPEALRAEEGTPDEGEEKE